MMFPDLAGLWTAMENQEPWEPTFPAGYTLAPDAAYRGNMIPRPIQGNHTSARWAPAETSTALSKDSPCTDSNEKCRASKSWGRARSQHQPEQRRGGGRRR